MTIDERKTNTRQWGAPTGFETVGGRERGRALLNLLLEQLGTLPADGVLLFDCSRIALLDFSAADEVVSGLVGRVIAGELGTRRFVLTGLSDALRESVTAVLTLRKRQCLELRADGRLQALGSISEPHRDTFDLITARGTVAAADVADRFSINLTAATNRLNALAESGLVLRRSERGGPRGSRLAYAAIVKPTQSVTDWPDETPAQLPQLGRHAGKEGDDTP